MIIEYENEICRYLNLPSIPKKEWDGKSEFKHGVAIVTLAYDFEAYAVATYNPNEDKEPRIVKSFVQEPFYGIKKIYVVPSYMDIDDIDDADLDEESKKNAKMLASEATEEENEGTEMHAKSEELPEWVFPFITNKEEAIAYIKSYRSKNRIKGKIPQTEDAIKANLYVIYKDSTNNK